MWPLFSRSLLILQLLVALSSVSSLARPIVTVSTPGGEVEVVDLGSSNPGESNRWGLASGLLGSRSNPIPLQDVKVLSLSIGDTYNPGFPVGGPQVNGLGPQTTFRNTAGSIMGHLQVLCFGCNGPRPSIHVLNSPDSLPLGVPRSVVARVSVGVDATLPNPPYTDDNSMLVEVWFARTGTSVNNPPTANAGPNQTVEFGETVDLQGTVFDPDGDPTTVLWSLVGGTGGSGIQFLRDGQPIEGLADTLGVSFVAPDEAKILTFQFCAKEVANPEVEVCDQTVVTVADQDGGGGGSGGGGGTDPVPTETACNAQGNIPANGQILNGAARTVSPGDLVALEASGNDADNSTNQLGISGVFFVWTVKNNGGLSFTLQKDQSQASFVAPEVTTSTTVVVGVTITDALDCGVEDEIHITIQASNEPPATGTNNTPPSIDSIDDQLGISGGTLTVTGSAVDADGDEPLYYLWSQISGPAVVFSTTNEKTTTITLPTVVEDVDVHIKFEVHDGILGSEVTFKVFVEAVVSNLVVFPASVGSQHPAFQGSYASAALVSLSSQTNQVVLSGRDSDGNETANVDLLPPLEALGQNAFLTQEKLGQGAGAVSVVAQGKQGPIQGFFMIGTYDRENLDGVGGTLHESKKLYLPLARQRGEHEATLLFILNVREQAEPAAQVRLYNQSGGLVRETTLPIAGFGSIVGTLDELYNDPDLVIDEGFIEISSSVTPLTGFLFYAQEQNFSSMTAQLGSNGRVLLAPHLFADSGDGDTEIRLLNTGLTKATVEVMAFDDASNELGSAEVEILPMELFVAGAKDFLNLQPEGLISGHLRLHTSGGTVGVFQESATLVGVVSFTGDNGKFRSTLPITQEGKRETLLLQVAQSIPLRMFTGLSILVPGENMATVTIQAFSEDGNLTAERTVLIEAGNRLVRLLNDGEIFGLGFEQVKGHLKIVSDELVLAFALFGDYSSGGTTFLAAIEGQAPID